MIGFTFCCTYWFNIRLNDASNRMQLSDREMFHLTDASLTISTASLWKLTRSRLSRIEEWKKFCRKLTISLVCGTIAIYVIWTYSNSWIVIKLLIVAYSIILAAKILPYNKAKLDPARKFSPLTPSLTQPWCSPGYKVGQSMTTKTKLCRCKLQYSND